VSARILDLNAGGSRLARMCTAAFSWARRGPVTIPGRAAGLGADDLMPELAERVRLLEQSGGRRAVVTVDPGFTPHECTWCKPARPRVTSVRVWGDPPQDGRNLFRPLLVTQVCLQCALGTPGCGGRGPRIGAVGQALVELRLGALVQIEVCE
jgi:hypothetical protein